MMRKASHSAATLLIRRGFAAKSHNFPRERRPVDLSSIREAKDAIRLFREAVEMSPQPSVQLYNKLLSVVAKMKCVMFDEMRQWSIPVNQYTMNIAINCCCHLKWVDFGFAALGNFLKQDCSPNSATFNTLLKGLFLVGKVEMAETFFQKFLILKPCEPNDRMILILMCGLCKAGKSLTALDFLEKTSYKPDVYSYNAVIDGLCKDGMVNNALHFLSEMPNKGVAPDVYTYNSIIDGLCYDRWIFCRSGNVDEPWCLFQEIPRMGLKYTTICYNNMMHGLFRAGRFADGVKLYKDLEARDC